VVELAMDVEGLRLVLEEQAARDPVEREELASSEIVAYLRSLPPLR
jgi:hypothetical protein